MTESDRAKQAYLDGVHAESLAEAVVIEQEAKRRGLWDTEVRDDGKAGIMKNNDGDYSAYDWVPEWKAGFTPPEWQQRVHRAKERLRKGKGL